MRAVRLVIAFSTLIDVLLEPNRVGRETSLVGWKARPRRQKCLGPTWLCPRHHRASRVHLTPGGLRLQLFEVVGRLLMRGMSHPQSSWPCSLHGQRLRDKRSSKSHTCPFRVSDLREPVL